MRVHYKREVLVSTAQFENTRIAIELEDDVQANKMKSRYHELKAQVHELLLEEIIDLKLGEQQYRRAQVADEVRKKYRL